jgi:hypothetical protein
MKGIYDVIEKMSEKLYKQERFSQKFIDKSVEAQF